MYTYVVHVPIVSLTDILRRKVARAPQEFDIDFTREAEDADNWHALQTFTLPHRHWDRAKRETKP